MARGEDYGILVQRALAVVDFYLSDLVQGAVPSCINLKLFLRDPAPLTQFETVDQATCTKSRCEILRQRHEMRVSHPRQLPPRYCPPLPGSQSQVRWNIAPPSLLQETTIHVNNLLAIT